MGRAPADGATGEIARPGIRAAPLLGHVASSAGISWHKIGEILGNQCSSRSAASR
jgi:hypothetical protein